MSAWATERCTPTELTTLADDEGSGSDGDDLAPVQTGRTSTPYARPDERSRSGDRQLRPGEVRLIHNHHVEITTEQVAALVAEQLPSLAGLDIRRVESAGTVNAIYRIGARVAARFPLQSADPAQLRERKHLEAAAATVPPRLPGHGKGTNPHRRTRPRLPAHVDGPDMAVRLYSHPHLRKPLGRPRRRPRIPHRAPRSTGGFRATDPALDLVAAWHLLADRPRERLRSRLSCTDLQRERGKAWAFQQAIGAYWYYRATNPEMAAMGRTTLERLRADTW